MLDREIKVVHLEPTDVCQAACPMCAREIDSHFDKRHQHHLNMEQIIKVFDAGKIANLNKMFMCGNYGDPAAGRHTMNIYKEFRKINADIVLGMNTNGALQSTLWWHELGRIFDKPKDYVVFSIDGLEDTNGMYRKNVVWTKLIANVEAFISAGGSAHWDMLVYKHNQHQVENAEQLARAMGFTWFRAKVSKRGFTADLQAPLGWQDPRIRSKQIVCHAIQEQSIYIDAQGRISPCCWLSARQQNFVKDFESIQTSWHSDQPNEICTSICGTHNKGNSFNSQWQKQIELQSTNRQ